MLVDAPDPDRATLGGIYATNTSGPRRYAAGRPRDQIIGVSFVTSEGVVVKGGGRVVKNVAGYDFPKLLTGSMGTLGIITQLTLKVRPIPEASAIVWVPFWNPKSLADTLDQLNTSGTRPVALEFLNGSGARTVGQGLGLPTGQGILAIGYEDNAGSVRWQIDRLKSELGRATTSRSSRERMRSRLWKALTDFQAVDARSGQLRRESSSVVGRVVRRGPRPGTMVGAGPRGQWDRPRPCTGRVDARWDGAADQEVPAHGDPGRGQPDPGAVSDRVEGEPAASGASRGPTGPSPNGSRRPSILTQP